MNRPDSDDFWLMAAIAQDLDAAADDNLALDRIMGGVDTDALMYVSTQRAMRLPNASEALRLAMGGAWIDGFAIGMNFARRQLQDRLREGL